jgi:hypothetical protein
MRDWTFNGASVDWKKTSARLEFNSAGTLKVVRAMGLSNMRLNRTLAWEPSAAVSQSEGPTKIDSGEYRLAIEMQGGGKIEVVARQFEMPSA